MYSRITAKLEVVDQKLLLGKMKDHGVFAFLVLAAGFAFVAPAAAEVDRDENVETATAYYLSAAAVPGDGLSAWLLAESLRISPDDSEETASAISRLLEQARASARNDNRLRGLMAREDVIPTEPIEALDSDDIVVLLLAMNRDDIRDDPVALQGLIHRAAQGGEFRPYYAAAVRSLYERFKSASVPDAYVTEPGDDPALAAAFSLAAFSVPSYLPLMRACRNARPPLSRDCHRLAGKIVSGSDCFIDALLAAAVLERSAEGPEQLKAARAARRQLGWLQQQSTRVQWNTASFSLFNELMQRDGELSAFRAVLQFQGLSLVPPADYQPRPLAP